MLSSTSPHAPYTPDSAGALSFANIPTASKHDSVDETIESIHSLADTFETVDYVYILDEQALIGVLSLHELLVAEGSITLAELMTTPVASVHVHTDQEKVAQLALAQNIKAVPVVDDGGLFVGVIPADVILQVLRDEHTEDILALAGLSITPGDTLASLTLGQHIRSRLPWLVLGLMGGVIAAGVVELFEETIAAEVALAAFIPAVVYIADAVGSQTQMVYVRSLTTSGPHPFFKVLSRELGIATVVGAVLSVLIFAISYAWLSLFTISLILSLAIVGTVYFSVIVAILLPWLFERAGFDPAVASGPLATVLRDVSSLCIYLLIASSIVL